MSDSDGAATSLPRTTFEKLSCTAGDRMELCKSGSCGRGRRAGECCCCDTGCKLEGGREGGKGREGVGAFGQAMEKASGGSEQVI
eukprot:756132-Hanusia_phi.AAC.1